MKVAVIYNSDHTAVINKFGMQNKESYNPKTVEDVAKALEKYGHHVRILDGNMHIVERLSAFMPSNISKNRPGIVFNMAYGIQGQSRYTHIPAMLEMLGVPYVGSCPAGHALALDKVIAKVLFQRNNLPTPAYWVYSNPNEIGEEVAFPAIVKPKMEAVSFGIKVVYNLSELREAVDFVIKEFSQQALVEEFIPGREFAVGLIGNGKTLETFPVSEIDLQGDAYAIQTMEDKKNVNYAKLCPAPIAKPLAVEMQELAKRAFHSLRLLDFARVDFRVDENNNIYILEVNSMASLSKTGSYVTQAKANGYSFDVLVNRMLEAAAVRYFGPEMQTLKTTIDRKERSLPLSARVQGYLRNKAFVMEDNLKEIVQINSHVRNIEGVNECGRIVTNKLTELGFQKQVFPQVEVGDILHFSNTNFSACDVLLLCHLDIPYQMINHNAYLEKGNYLLGPGIAENKGGIIVMLHALQALRYARTLKNVRCSVLLTTDDSLQGRYSKEIIHNISQQAGTVLGLKHGGKNDTVVASRCGSGYYTIDVLGTKPKGGEPGQSQEIQVLCHKMLNLSRLSKPELGLFVDPVYLNAESGLGTAAYSSRGAVRVRFTEEIDFQAVDRKIRAIVNKNNNPHIKIQLSGGIRRLPTRNTDKSLVLLETAKHMAQKLDLGISEEYRWSSSDICHVASEVGILDGLGPIGGDCRSTNEYILRSSLVDRAALLAMIISEGLGVKIEFRSPGFRVGADICY